MHQTAAESGVIGQPSSAVADLIHGRRRPARVVAVMRAAAYLATDSAAVPAIAVVTADAVRLPNAVVLPTRAAELPFASIWPGSPATVGEGAILLGPLNVTGGGSWTPPRPRLHNACAALERAHEVRRLTDIRALPVPEMLCGPLLRLERAICARAANAIQSAAHQLVGLGPGLTPSGDDVLSGVLATCHALSDGDHSMTPVGSAVAKVLDRAPRRTSFVSAALMRHAARGEVIPQLAALLTALETAEDLHLPLAQLLSVGHHSGSDLARGVALGLLTAAPHSTDRERSMSSPTR